MCEQHDVEPTTIDSAGYIHSVPNTPLKHQREEAEFFDCTHRK